MKFILNISLNVFVFLSILNAQVKPTIYPLSTISKEIIKKEINNSNFSFSTNNKIEQYTINLNYEDLYIFTIEGQNLENLSIFIINRDSENFIGPYTSDDIINNKIKTDIIRGGDFIIEINNDKIRSSNDSISFYISYQIIDKSPINSDKIKPFRTREEPVIMVTGYWPPTNEMIRHFSQDETLNPNGWAGDNWENLGYDIISYFPTFNPPDCSSCGQGNGLLEVDYQDTSEDFWPLADGHNPIALITFSKGFNNYSWELEFNAYNRTNWINDFTSPYLPTPNPPDEEEESFYLRNSNLPMDNIVNNINSLNIGLDSYIDVNGDPGHYVSEFMAYHGTWYRDLNQNEEEQCYLAGHVHVGGQISWDNAKLATEETIRTVIDYLDQFNYTPGDVNQDTMIDILDIVILINYILGLNDLTTVQFYASDMNEDSIVNIQDLIIVINIILNNN